MKHSDRRPSLGGRISKLTPLQRRAELEDLRRLVASHMRPTPERKKLRQRLAALERYIRNYDLQHDAHVFAHWLYRNFRRGRCAQR